MKGCPFFLEFLRRRLQWPCWTLLSVSSHLIHSRSMAVPSCGERRKWTVHTNLPYRHHPSLLFSLYTFSLSLSLCHPPLFLNRLIRASFPTTPTVMSITGRTFLFSLALKSHSVPSSSALAPSATLASIFFFLFFLLYLAPIIHHHHHHYHHRHHQLTPPSLSHSLDFLKVAWHYLRLFHSSPVLALQTSQETPAWRSAITLFTFPFKYRGSVALWYVRDEGDEPNAVGSTVNGDQLNGKKNERETERQRERVV